ncbi:uncharacterized protein LOC135468558 isoform X2 [Liolophura sinensis]|uniref:uncharacterized protein LOC135468558 isoform X2 n=1 Tax=Liolophura sinensis TaxID=3198878 RepID=UPI003158F19D
MLQGDVPNSDKLNPPYNFQGMCSTDGDLPDKTPKAPGRSRKGKLYDPKPTVESEGTVSMDKQKVTTNRNSNHSLGASGKNGKQMSRSNQDFVTDVGQGVQTFMALGDVVNREHSPSTGKFIRQVLVEDGPHGKRYLYQFDQSNMQYYEVEDVSSSSVMPRLAEKVEKVAERGFQELFGCLKIVFICVVLFTVELMKFLFRTVLGPILSGFISAVGDHLLKPVFAGLFNSLLHPTFALLWNILASLHNALGPLLQITREMVSQLALLFAACRLVQITTVSDKRAEHSQTIQNV